MMPRLVFLLSYFIFLMASLQAQDSMLLNRSFRFDDGIYLNYEQFKNNRPAYSMEDISMVYVVNPQTLLAQVASVTLPSEEKLDLSKLWGVCIKGRPFIQVNKERVGKSLASFAGFSVLGQLCFFTFDVPVEVPVEIKAYNPLTGKPFRSGTISKTEVRQAQLMMDFQSGEILPFSKNNLLKWVDNDSRISNLVRSLEPDDGDTLLRALIAYNDRNLLFIKVESRK